MEKNQLTADEQQRLYEEKSESILKTVTETLKNKQPIIIATEDNLVLSGSAAEITAINRTLRRTVPLLLLDRTTGDLLEFLKFLAKTVNQQEESEA